jgi:beta-N-acetylhexosaminidase
LEEGGLLAFSEAIGRGAEMIMTSATTFPLIDEEVLMADGATKGYYPATLSAEIITKTLREALGFDGVVMTDALEMEQFVIEPDNGKPLFSGRSGGVAHDLQVAEKAINVGCDILLLPTDLNGKKAAQYYDDYISGIVGLVHENAISAARIDEAARRILTLKARHGLLDMDTGGADVAQKIKAAEQVVGSPAHHAIEAEIAAKAVTLLKDDGILPLSGKGSRVVLLGRTKYDDTPIRYALRRLMDEGFIDPQARIENRISGEASGDKDAETSIVIDCYYATGQGGRLLYSDSLAAAIRNADAVVCLSSVGAGIKSLQDDSLPMIGVSRALSDARKGGAKFVLLSDSLPVDAARFQDADAIVCAYLSAGFGVDPTARTSGSENVGAFNANAPAALCAIFGAADMPGKLPISIPVLEKEPDGSWAYGGKILYERGFSASE